MKAKIDFYGQIILVSIIVLSMLVSLVYPGGVIFGLLGMIPLGIWQLLSAAAYTYRLHHSDKKPLLQAYWRISLITLLALMVCFFLEGSGDFLTILFIATIVAGFATAVYYLYVYNKHLLKHE